jgi:hypothetical protein
MLNPNLPKEDKNMLLEVRIGGGDKGAQTVFPDSTHEEGDVSSDRDRGSCGYHDSGHIMPASGGAAALLHPSEGTVQNL